LYLNADSSCFFLTCSFQRSLASSVMSKHFVAFLVRYDFIIYSHRCMLTSFVGKVHMYRLGFISLN
jgi:hypothetical protein